MFVLLLLLLLRYVTCLWGIVKYGFCAWQPINQVTDENIIGIYYVFH